MIFWEHKKKKQPTWRGRPGIAMIRRHDPPAESYTSCSDYENIWFLLLTCREKNALLFLLGNQEEEEEENHHHHYVLSPLQVEAFNFFTVFIAVYSSRSASSALIRVSTHGNYPADWLKSKKTGRVQNARNDAIFLLPYNFIFFFYKIYKHRHYHPFGHFDEFSISTGCDIWVI